MVVLTQEDLKALVGSLNRDYGHPLKKFQTYEFQDFDRKIAYKPLKTVDEEKTPYFQVLIDGKQKGLVHKGYKVVLVGELVRLAGLQGELPPIKDAELRVGLHPQWGALPPRAGSRRLYSCLYPHTGV